MQTHLIKIWKLLVEASTPRMKPQVTRPLWYALKRFSILILLSPLPPWQESDKFIQVHQNTSCWSESSSQKSLCIDISPVDRFQPQPSQGSASCLHCTWVFCLHLWELRVGTRAEFQTLWQLPWARWVPLLPEWTIGNHRKHQIHNRRYRYINALGQKYWQAQMHLLLLSYSKSCIACWRQELCTWDQIPYNGHWEYDYDQQLFDSSIQYIATKRHQFCKSDPTWLEHLIAPNKKPLNWH